MSDETPEIGSLASPTTETPENDKVLSIFESAPQHLDEVDKHVWRRHLESFQDLMLDHKISFIDNSEFAKAEALERTNIEIGGETDSLTGLKNRNGLKRAIEDLVGNEKRSGDNTKAVFIRADANGLKLLNDKLGHKAGDEFLKKIGITIEGVRDGDIAARDGGDEFGILLTNTDLAGATVFWERFNAELPEGISIVGGASVFDFNDVEGSMHADDKLMYEAKKESKDSTEGNQNFGKNILRLPTIIPNDEIAA